jgi:glucose/arabinose dehydrogenase
MRAGRGARCGRVMLAAALATAAFATAAAQGPAAPERFVMRVVTQGLDAPWEIAWGPDGQLWVTERRGRRVLRVNPADGVQTVALVLPDVHQSVTQDGLLGLALHPGLLRGSQNDFVFLAFTYDDAPGPAFVRRMAMRRYTFDRATNQLTSPADVLTGLPVHDDHLAGRLVFGSDGMLYLSLGDEGANFGGNRCNVNHALDLPTAAEVAAKNWTSYQGKISGSHRTDRFRATTPRWAACAATCSRTATGIRRGSHSAQAGVSTSRNTVPTWTTR